MEKKSGKRKLKIGRIMVALLIVVMLILGISYLLNGKGISIIYQT